jgi:GH15 family glucan-1,4-alpha-glucosidase
MMPSQAPYPPISDYALISNCQCAALVSTAGSIDWCCMPRMDDDSCFGRLLDWQRGGYCSIAPTNGDYQVSRRYLPNSMVLETRFSNEQGELRLVDFFYMPDDGERQSQHDCMRLAEVVRGRVSIAIEVCPRFDYGDIFPQLRQLQDRAWSAVGSNKGLLIAGPRELQTCGRHDLRCEIQLQEGQAINLTLRSCDPECIPQAAAGLPGLEGVHAGLQHSLRWWGDWTDTSGRGVGNDAQSARSALVLKALCYQPTGAIAAAATTSLPEALGEERNWDYRFSWVRDSVFAVRALSQLGHVQAADRFHHFIQRAAAGSASQLQIMYGLDGKRRLTEVELPWLEGYRASRPVRVGNRAAKQVQLDIYGELMEMAWEWHTSGHETDQDYWNFLVDVADQVCQRWQETDHGIWEVRKKPGHYVHSKVMCWSALNRAFAMAQDRGHTQGCKQWQEHCDGLRQAIESRGYDEQRGVFVQAFENKALDAALLLLPRVGFVDWQDERMVRTVDAIMESLDRDGLLLRYDAPDALRGQEGCFLPCTFWLVSCLAHQGRHELAWQYYRRALACANDLGLFSEEYDGHGHQMLGNFPQALTHVSQIMARQALAGHEPLS